MANIKVTQVKSVIGRPQTQRRTMRGLGLKKIGDSNVLPDNESTRGAIFKVKHLVKTEEE